MRIFKKKVFLVLISIVVCLFLLWGILKAIAYNASSIPELHLTESIHTPQGQHQLDTWFHQLQVLGKFNGQVGIVRNGTPLFVKAYGVTNYTRKSPLTTASSLRLASLSKQFTAFGIMVLKEQGKLDFDDNVSQYLPDFPYKDVHIRQLLTMTSGIPDTYIGLAEKHKDKVGDTLSIQEALQLICAYPAKAVPPKSEYAYANTNYILLAAIIEHISQDSFENFMQQEVFTPLQLQHTRVWNLLSPQTTFPGKAEGIFRSGNTFTPAIPLFVDGVAGDGGIFSSVEDLIRWDAALYDNPLVSKETLAEAFSPVILTNGELSSYGFGWVVRRETLTHSGGWLAARTYIYRNTTDKSCLVLLDNLNNSRYLSTIQKVLLEKLYDR